MARSACLLAVALLLVGCSGSGSDGGDKCRGELNDLGSHCPGSFDGKAEHIPGCSGGTTSQTVRTCRSTIILVKTIQGGLGRESCYYNPQTSALVGVKVSGDLRNACGEFFMFAGDVDETECTDTVTQTCP